MTRDGADYTEALKASAAQSAWKTARQVPPDDMNRLTHQLRYQAEKLGFLIEIHTDPEGGAVSFRCSSENNSKGAKR